MLRIKQVMDNQMAKYVAFALAKRYFSGISNKSSIARSSFAHIALLHCSDDNYFI